VRWRESLSVFIYSPFLEHQVDQRMVVSLKDEKGAGSTVGREKSSGSRGQCFRCLSIGGTSNTRGRTRTSPQGLNSPSELLKTRRPETRDKGWITVMSEAPKRRGDFELSSIYILSESLSSRQYVARVVNPPTYFGGAGTIRVFHLLLSAPLLHERSVGASD
jgi:hypothetical protein